MTTRRDEEQAPAPVEAPAEPDSAEAGDSGEEEGKPEKAE